jgi:hypothetical protein
MGGAASASAKNQSATSALQQAGGKPLASAKCAGSSCQNK